MDSDDSEYSDVDSEDSEDSDEEFGPGFNNIMHIILNAMASGKLKFMGVSYLVISFYVIIYIKRTKLKSRNFNFLA